MASWRLEIAYDGGAFRGWARQPGQATVQAELEAALERMLGEPVSLAVAGRTDAGVHAWGQVASLELPERAPSPARLRAGLNALTSPAIAVTACEPAPDGFDARRDALSRTYCYRVQTGPVALPFERGRALWWPYPLDREALDACAAAIMGRHDFTAFTPTDGYHVHFQRQILTARWESAPFTATHHSGVGLAAPLTAAPPAAGLAAGLCFWVEADAFMRGMVRTLVGTMLEVARGRRSVAGFERLLAGSGRLDAGPTAPAHGLYLARIHY